MALPNKRPSKEVLLDWVTRCREEHNKPLTDWECEFLDDMEEKLTLGYSLSEKQEQILERIYTEKVP